MTRFDAAEPAARRTLIQAAITAHRERGSPYLTVEAREPEVAWVQYRAADGVLNLDCTPEEYDRLTTVLEDYPALTITEQHEPDDAAGINVRIQGYTDDTRYSQFIDDVFREVYVYPDTYRLWVVEL